MKRPLALHWPSVRGRARADAGPLALVAGVVTAVALLAGAVPPLLRSTADDATRDAVRRAGDQAAVRVEASWEPDYGLNGRIRNSRVAEELDNFRDRAKDALDPALRAALEPPIATVSSISLQLTDGSVQRHFQVDYLRGATDGPALTWVSGGAPKGTVPDNREVSPNGPPWEVQVGISEASAAALKLGPGDHVPVQDEQYNKYNVLVSGIFRAADPNDPAWGKVPWALQPVAGLDGTGTTRLGGLLSSESLPDARLTFQPDQLRRTVWFSADPDKLTWASAQALAATVATLKATSAASGERDDSLKWATQLDAVLRAVRDQVTAASAQASVLLITVLGGAALVLLLAAELLARRRALALIAARQRGGSLPDLAAELLIESVAVAVPAAVAGLLLAYAVAGGAAIGWSVPVVVCAILAGPGFGVVAAARATRDRRAPANRSARRWAQRTAQLRRLSVDLAVVAAAVGAIVALRQRGISAGQDVALPASAPLLGVVAGALLLRRLMPGATGLALRQSLRSRRPLAVFGAARAAATSARVLPMLVLMTTTALAAFAVSLETTTARGLADGAWHTTGAEARFDVGPDATGTTADAAARIAAAPGVDRVASGQVIDSARVIADNNSVTPALVIVDAAGFRRLLADTPLPDAPDLDRLSAAGPLPALVRSTDGTLSPGVAMRLLRQGDKPLDLTAVGTAPAVDDARDVIIVDTATAAAAGLVAVPDTIWATGPGAARAVLQTGVSGHAVIRADVLHERRTAPLTKGLVLLDRGAAVALLVLGLLGFALGAAASAPQRWETLARLRTLGLRPRDTHRVAGGELLPPVLMAAVLGPLLGALLVRLTFGPLSLRLLTEQAEEPATAIPWWLLGLVPVVLLAGLIAVVAGEAAVRRRRRLADVLRVGGN